MRIKRQNLIQHTKQKIENSDNRLVNVDQHEVQHKSNYFSQVENAHVNMHKFGIENLKQMQLKVQAKFDELTKGNEDPLACLSILSLSFNETPRKQSSRKADQCVAQFAATNSGNLSDAEYALGALSILVNNPAST